MVRAHVWVSGFVQGVFFRYETRTEAMRLKVNGWVKNLRDEELKLYLKERKKLLIR